MEIVVKMIGMVWIVVLAMQLQGFLSHRREVAAVPVLEHDLSYTHTEEGEASFS